jgi:hypothetical protein
VVVRTVPVAEAEPMAATTGIIMAAAETVMVMAREKITVTEIMAAERMEGTGSLRSGINCLLVYSFIGKRY